MFCSIEKENRDRLMGSKEVLLRGENKRCIGIERKVFFIIFHSLRDIKYQREQNIKNLLYYKKKHIYKDKTSPTYFLYW